MSDDLELRKIGQACLATMIGLGVGICCAPMAMLIEDI
jgi:hypothetical protein